MKTGYFILRGQVCLENLRPIPPIPPQSPPHTSSLSPTPSPFLLTLYLWSSKVTFSPTPNTKFSGWVTLGVAAALPRGSLSSRDRTRICIPSPERVEPLADAAVLSGKKPQHIRQSRKDGGGKTLRFLSCLGEVYLAIWTSSALNSQGMSWGSSAWASAGAGSSNCRLLGITITSNCYPCRWLKGEAEGWEVQLGDMMQF